MAKRIRKCIYKFIMKLSALIFVSRTKVEGMDNLPTKEGFIIAANHISILDPFVILGAMKQFLRKHYMKRGKKFYGIGNIKLKKKIALKFLVDEEVGFIPNTKEGSYRAVELINKGNIVLICPEGGINLKDYLVRGKDGVAYMAMLSGAAVIPLAIPGQPTVTFFRTVKILFKPKKLIFGSPMSFPKRQLSYLILNRLLASVVTHKIMYKIAELAGKEYRFYEKKPD